MFTRRCSTFFLFLTHRSWQSLHRCCNRCISGVHNGQLKRRTTITSNFEFFRPITFPCWKKRQHTLHMKYTPTPRPPARASTHTHPPLQPQNARAQYSGGGCASRPFSWNLWVLEVEFLGRVVSSFFGVLGNFFFGEGEKQGVRKYHDKQKCWLAPDAMTCKIPDFDADHRLQVLLCSYSECYLALFSHIDVHRFERTMSCITSASLASVRRRLAKTPQNFWPSGPASIFLHDLHGQEQLVRKPTSDDRAS